MLGRKPTPAAASPAAPFNQERRLTFTRSPPPDFLKPAQLLFGSFRNFTKLVKYLASIVRAVRDLVAASISQYSRARQLRRCDPDITFTQPRHDPTALLDHLQAAPEAAAAAGRAGRARLAAEGLAAGRVDATGRQQGVAGNRDDL